MMSCCAQVQNVPVAATPVILATPAAAVPAVKPCCLGNDGSAMLDKLEVVCRVALGVFAAMLAPVRFQITFCIGATLGAAYRFYVAIKEGTMSQEPRAKPVCAQGYMETLSGMKFSPPINLIATAVFVGEHIRHDPCFFVPFTGLFVGTWVGRQIASSGWNLSSRVWRPIPIPCCKA